MSADSTIKNFLFIIFFGVGICSVFLSILSEEIENYYQIKINQQETEIAINKIIEDDQQTEQLIKDIEDNPDIVERLGPLKLGTEPNDPNAIEVHLRESELREVQKILESKITQNQTKIEIPLWVNRINHQLIRKILFFAGSGLILLAFTCFRTNPKNIDV